MAQESGAGLVALEGNKKPQGFYALRLEIENSV